jgi:hypothetical protein
MFGTHSGHNHLAKGIISYYKHHFQKRHEDFVDVSNALVMLQVWLGGSHLKTTLTCIILKLVTLRVARCIYNPRRCVSSVILIIKLKQN